MNVLNPELIAKLNEKLGGLLDIVNTTNVQQLFQLIVKYNVTSSQSVLVISSILFVISVIAFIIFFFRYTHDECISEGCCFLVMVLSGMMALCTIFCICSAGYDLFMWCTNPEISALRWLK